MARPSLFGRSKKLEKRKLGPPTEEPRQHQSRAGGRIRKHPSSSLTSPRSSLRYGRRIRKLVEQILYWVILTVWRNGEIINRRKPTLSKQTP